MKIRKRRFIVGKILTISIAAYNVESYIKENIESILLSKSKNDIAEMIRQMRLQRVMKSSNLIL